MSIDSVEIIDSTPHPDYFAEIPKESKKNIDYIIKTLATTTFVWLTFYADELNRRGNKIRDIHPLKHLLYVVTTPKLQDHLATIRTNLIWGKYWEEFSESLQHELDNDNLSPEHSQHFAESTGFDVSTELNEGRWNDFIDRVLGIDEPPA